MFEPVEELQAIKIGISSAEQYFDHSQLDDNVEIFIPSSTLSLEGVNQHYLDLLLVNGSYLQHGELDVNVYAQTNEQLTCLLPSYAQFTSSILSDGVSECSVLVGVRV